MDVIVWPLVVLLLGFGFMFLFKRPIAGLLDRTKRVSKSGLETFENPQVPAPHTPDPLTEFMGSFDNPLLRQQETDIDRDLQNRGFTETNAIIKALTRSLAGTQILAAFERVQNIIWASQISLLTVLNGLPNGMTEDEARPFYDNAAAGFPVLYEHYTFDNWLAFLESQMLIERRSGRINISLFGREFLKWRVDAGRAGPFHG
jgi:hypothetical protein